MARALWSGSLSFGLVNVPVVLVTAVRDLDLHFRQLHEKDGAPIEVQRWCSKEDVEVPYEEITHGYELEDGRQVIITDEELEALEPRRTRTIDIEQFVDLDEVVWTEPPEREEAGSPNVVGAVALHAAIDALGQIGWESITAHDDAMSGRLRRGLAAIPGVHVLGPAGLLSRSFSVARPPCGPILFPLKIWTIGYGRVLPRSPSACGLLNKRRMLTRCTSASQLCRRDSITAVCVTGSSQMKCCSA